MIFHKLEMGGALWWRGLAPWGVALCGVVARGDRLSARLHGDQIFDTSSFVDERSRVAEFKRRWGSWPPPALLERELPSYSAAMAAREAEAMKLTDSQDRWDAWMFIAQARLMRNFTARQWEVVKAPAEVHSKILAQVRASLGRARPEASLGGQAAHSGVRGPNEPDFLEQEHLNYWALDVLKPLHEAWAGVELEPTSVYGVRLYRDGATLADHLDIPETHVISSVFHIDSDVDEPFLLEIEDATGAYAGVDLKPGDMMFYESAKCFHRRSAPMRGTYYGSLFLHYRPKDWPFSRNEIRFAVPPHWGDGLGRDPPPDRGGAVEVDATGDARPAARSDFTVTFALGAAAPQDLAVQLLWLEDGGKEHLINTLDAANPAIELTTFHGHRFAARPSDGSDPRLFTMAPETTAYDLYGA